VPLAVDVRIKIRYVYTIFGCEDAQLLRFLRGATACLPACLFVPLRIHVIGIENFVGRNEMQSLMQRITTYRSRLDAANAERRREWAGDPVFSRYSVKLKAACI
jgi:hypothetical protein